jgi:hypothetical protein
MGVLILGCSSAQRTPYDNQASESLFSIVNEILLERGRDVYRMPYPLDAEGKNLFENALSRVDTWNSLHPGEFMDIVWYTRGVCHEKLGHLQQAFGCYSSVEADKPDLQKSADERAEVMSDLMDLLGQNPGSDLQVSPAEPGVLLKPREKSAIEEYGETEYESLVMLCLENIAVQRVSGLRGNSEAGARTAYKNAIEELIVEFEESKRIHQHWMRLGLYYEDTMREWITQAEYGTDPKAWELAKEALNKAEEIYFKVSRADGYTEKREAQARLELLRESALKIEQNLS